MPLGIGSCNGSDSQQMWNILSEDTHKHTSVKCYTKYKIFNIKCRVIDVPADVKVLIHQQAQFWLKIIKIMSFKFVLLVVLSDPSIILR